MEQTGGGHTYTYKQYRERWQMLAIVFLANVVIQIVFISFAPIATPATQYFQIDATGINWFALVWPALFLPGTVASAWLYHKYGLRSTMTVAGIVMAIGTGVRVISVAVPIDKSESGESQKGRTAYSLVLIGTIMVATVQPIILSSTTQVASAWFSEKQRALANTLVRANSTLTLHGSAFPKLARVRISCA
jgi:MFS transporter, FLVCR family, MFS-domain-containing protein 7